MKTPRGILNDNTFKINTTKSVFTRKALSTFLSEVDHSHHEDHKSSSYYQCRGHFQLTDSLFYPGTMLRTHTTVTGRRGRWILIWGDKTWTFAAQWDYIVLEECFWIWLLFLINFIIRKKKRTTCARKRTPGSWAAHLTEISGWLFAIYLILIFIDSVAHKGLTLKKDQGATRYGMATQASSGI